ncbi:MAG TPA: hypothetical protein VFJ00_04380 [Candidatus Limnocylindria bacterium]|nr:hypothetical protein [Candidatus Limnocylindria bacterium]
MNLRRGARGEEAGEATPRADRLDLGCPARDDDLLRPDVEHPVLRPRDERRSGVDRDHLDPLRRIEEGDLATGALRLRSCGGSAPPAADDRQIGLFPVHRDLRRLRLGVVPGGRAIGRVPADLHLGARRRLAGAHVGDPVHLGDAVAAIAGQAERAAVLRVLAGAQDRDRHRVAGLVGQATAVKHEPARLGAHGREAITRPARAGAQAPRGPIPARLVYRHASAAEPWSDASGHKPG